jgi:predicted dehydrogenase
MAEKKGIELVAICDVDEAKFQNYKADFNIRGLADGEFDFSKFHCYTDVDDMLANEKELDMVSVIVPTYLHCEISCKCLEAGINVFCEKPMALNLEQCQKMIDTAKKADNETLEDYLNKKVFTDISRTSLHPNEADVKGFQAYIKKYRQLLKVEQAATDSI